MNSFDSLTLKYFFEENKDFINGAIVQKIQLPSRYEIILNIRNIKCAKNKKLYININPKYPHICFVNDISLKKRDVEVPKVPPMFCMQLRKYLSGSKIKDFRLVKYERILELYFDYFDEIGSLTRLCLAFEFMGKYSNVILYNVKTKKIIGSMHNVSSQKSSVREIYGGINYIYPPLKEKLDILKCSYSTFYQIAKDRNLKLISDNFYYFSQPVLNKIFDEMESLEEIFNFLQALQSGENKEFIINFWDKTSNLTDAIDNYFSEIMFLEILKSKKSQLIGYIKKDYQKIKKILKNVPDDKKAEKYKKIGEYIMSNLYNENIKNNVDGIEIELDKNISLSDNAQKYFKLYKKAKNEFQHSEIRYNEAKLKFEYYETIMLNIELINSFEEINEVLDEYSDMGIVCIKDKNKKQQNKFEINPIVFMNHEIYLGKNNKQNDYIISKIASGEDLWFHGLNFPSAHVILKLKNNENNLPGELLEYCARLVKENSKAKFSGKTSIIMTKRKNLKKPPNTYLGYVTYKNETEIVV